MLVYRKVTVVMTFGEATAIVAFSVVVIDYGVEIVKRIAAGKTGTYK